MKKTIPFLFLLFIFSGVYAQTQNNFYTDSRPYTRWWWFADVIDKSSVRDNLVWLKNNGFGGVEIAWVYPLNRMNKDTINYTPRQEWLSKEWSEITAYAKQTCDSLGLGCDFTFGTLWPFGDSDVPFEEATMNLKEKEWRQEITASWEYPKKGYVIDHLNRKALYNYGGRIANALKPALKGGKSGLFCDSWEVETKYLATKNFEEIFIQRYSYEITPFIDSLYSPNEPYASVRYDYMKLISELVIEEFYKPFTEVSNKLGAFSRVQVSGAPCDLISGYATADVPESEAMLFEPPFSTIPASSAALSGKKVITSETFTCLYGWPRIRLGEEQTADLKLVADALFANGVNHIIWHGKPYNKTGTDTTKFYASVHVGSSGSLAEEIPAFNKYLEKVSGAMKEGRTYSDIAVYLPTEDGYIKGELPIEKQFIWAWGEYEQRYTYFPDELKNYRPLWINSEFLKKAKFENGILSVGDAEFKALYLAVTYLDIEALRTITSLAKSGLNVIIKQIPKEPGLSKNYLEYFNLIRELTSLKNIQGELTGIEKFITGKINFDFWCRETDEGLTIFFANPKSKGLKFPIEYGQSLTNEEQIRDISISYNNNIFPLRLEFKPYQSLLVKISKEGKVHSEDISFTPKTPVYIPRIKEGKDRWEVEKK